MGYSTRIDVPLRAYVPTGDRDRNRPRYESYTDLDVLGINIAPGFATRKVIADCKTTLRGSTERMFWIRGVSDFFSANDAWMVRSSGVTAAARQLSARLHISVLEKTDLELLEEHHPSALNLNIEPLSILFDHDSVQRYMKEFTTLDKRLRSLLEYRQFDYWVYDPHRNLMQLVAHVSQVSKLLDPHNPAHRSLFYECAWLYTLSITQAAAHVRAAHVTAIDTSLQEYLFGGQIALQEKQRLAHTLRKLAPGGLFEADDGVLPHWYPQLLELLTRHLRRPYAINNELRYAEWLSESQRMKPEVSTHTAFSDSFDALSAKLLADVCGFLVTVTGINPDFRAHARRMLAQQPQIVDQNKRQSNQEKDSQDGQTVPESTSQSTPSVQEKNAES